MINARRLAVNVGGKVILNEVSFAVDAGEVVAVVGPNGAGKSTLLKALCGDVTVQSGHITIAEKPLHKWDLKSLAKVRAVLCQSYDVEFPFLVDEIINMASFAHQLPLEKWQEIVNDVCVKLDINELRSKSFTQLSGGEKQRVQFARVLCQLQPALHQKVPCALLIDEPTANLDLFHQFQIMQLAKQSAKQGAAVVMVVHDLALAASFSNRIYLLERGEVKASGLPDSVLNMAQLKQTYNIPAELSQVKGCLPSLKVHQHPLSV
ncbi:putative Hemin ABC transport system ATP-binding protein hmuV [Pseudoalteromonas luteoviolacea B = ATCC 29581]|nr:putative Hemin ABC transport system ATP-binding protein hmuV [Pseudoalteromonas luteoviolacea B = ATCC 29581]